ncbi:MAG: glycosyltransferase family 2 protein [Opitutaceae bacterium]
MPSSPSHSSSERAVPAPRLSIVVPLFNCLALTRAMLDSLRATLPADVTHEIILVDDGSTDGTREWLRTARELQSAPFRVLLNERNLGFAGANNRAVALARGEVIALLNNDLILLPGWLEPMLAALDRLGDRAGLVGNVQRDARTGDVDHAGLEVTPAAKPVHRRHLPGRLACWLQPVRPVAAVTGACLLLRRALWRELGGFDEGYVNGGEDIDLGYRARATGRVTVVALRSVVRHHVSSSPGRKARDEQNSFRLAQRWERELTADAWRPWCREFLQSSFGSPREREYPVVFAALAYLAGFRREPPPEAWRGVAEGMARELARWRAMFPS